MTTRRRWPPLTPRMCQLPMTVLAASVRPSSATTPSATSAGVGSPGALRSRRRAAYKMVSRTVSVPISTSSCVTYAERPYARFTA